MKLRGAVRGWFLSLAMRAGRLSMARGAKAPAFMRARTTNAEAPTAVNMARAATATTAAPLPRGRGISTSGRSVLPRRPGGEGDAESGACDPGERRVSGMLI